MNIFTYIKDKLTRERQALYFEDTREIQYDIGRPLTARELQVLWAMDSDQISMIKKWVRESKNNANQR